MMWIGSAHPAEIAREFYRMSGEPWQTAGEQIAAEIEQRGRPIDWQPIETAPKDKTAFLIYCPERGDVFQVYRFEADGPFRSFNSGGRVVYQSASHWMPLPGAPEVQP